MGYTNYKEHWDQKSESSAEQLVLRRLFVDAHQRRFDVVLFWSLDRFSRKGVPETLNHRQKLSAAGVQFKSFTEQYIERTGMFRETIIGLLVATKQEFVRFSERIKARQACSSKAPAGRPVLADEVVAELRCLRGSNEYRKRTVAWLLQNSAKDLIKDYRG